jgi:hypothetical protein
VPRAFINNNATTIQFICMNAGGTGTGTVPYDGGGGLQITGTYSV